MWWACTSTYQQVLPVIVTQTTQCYRYSGDSQSLLLRRLTVIVTDIEPSGFGVTITHNPKGVCADDIDFSGEILLARIAVGSR